jgi:hypothetical protein
MYETPRAVPRIDPGCIRTRIYSLSQRALSRRESRYRPDR